MSNIDKQALREAAEKATPGPWRMALTKFNGITHGKFSFTKEDIIASSPEKRNAIFIAAANPATVLALLDEIAGLEQGHCGAALLEREESHAKTVGKLLDELEAKDKSIGFLKDQLAQLANFNPDWDKLEAATDSLREHMAKLSSAERRIAEQRGIILSARNFISEYAERGDVGAEEFVSIIDRAAGTAKGE
ncbi:ead/Ea22-like family protein [Enterobacter kobei]|uniref:ead/Ea22-like family protein n=1 Tax=Enterobacter kobei TaxID=208224 RepID=UPI003D6E75F6